MKHKPVRLFPWIHNIKDFLEQDHPTLHPDSASYDRYWQGVERKCIEGKWGFDGDKDNPQEGHGWRWMPGNLYYYINICKIIDEDDLGNATQVINPKLRDVDWMFIYGWITARGFSGFEDDTERSCHYLLKKLRDGEELDGKDNRILKRVKDFIVKPDGSYKEYVEPREYLYQVHKEPYGLALFLNPAKNFFVLGPRGFGKSYLAANAVVGHEYNFYGKTRMDDEYLYNPSPVEIFVGAANSTKSGETLKKFEFTQEYLKTSTGAYGKGENFIPGYFHSNHSGTLHAGKSLQHKYEEKINGQWVKSGTGTKITHGVYTVENPQAAVGTRPTVMLIEEVGILGNVLDVHASNETCQIRRTKFGSSLYIGTGGNIEKITEPKIIFEDPEAYGFIGYKDHWEGRTKPIGFFLPAYYVDNDFKDEQGNTDLEASLAYEMKERKKRASAANSSALDGYVMARPLIPSEIWLTPGAQIFPIQPLRERLSYLETRDIEKLFSVGMLEYEDSSKKQVEWKEDMQNKLIPIDTMNLDSYQKKGNLYGAIRVYEHPAERPPQRYRNRTLYKVTYDPFKDDISGQSLAAIIVHKSFSTDWEGGLQDAIVATYLGRPETVEEAHEIAIKLAMYYNTKVLYENNINDFTRYCRRTHRMHILQPAPWLAISKSLKGSPNKKYDAGVTMSGPLNAQCEQLIKQWLMEPAGHRTEDELLTNISKINSKRILRELIAYDRKTNCDLVSAMKLMVLWLYQEHEQPVEEAKPPKTAKYKQSMIARRRAQINATHAWYQY